MLYSIAVAGATGNVGREVLSILAEHSFPARKVVALASSRSVGKEISYGEDRTLIVQDLAKFDYSQTDIVLSSPGGAISAIHSPRAAKAGAIVIDNTSHFRMDDNVPLVIPEVNETVLQDFLFQHQQNPGGIIANPNCSTIQMIVALKPLHDLATITRVNVATYQSTSGAGKEAMDELYDQTRAVFTNDR
ncbi:MAG: aspartate-semialdehyde dehydrogenase, partial [Alphaproteobacteria bacterium]|nr:aspartate-semialdehyde dehydrogenase [Alphaproteobacteria bacterium]